METCPQIAVYDKVLVSRCLQRGYIVNFWNIDFVELNHSNPAIGGIFARVLTALLTDAHQHRPIVAITVMPICLTAPSRPL